MEKDNAVKFGTTRCDLCHRPGVKFYGDYLVCTVCAHQVENVKKAAEEAGSLKAAGIRLKNSHKVRA